MLASICSISLPYDEKHIHKILFKRRRMSAPEGPYFYFYFHIPVAYIKCGESTISKAAIAPQKSKNANKRCYTALGCGLFFSPSHTFELKSIRFAFFHTPVIIHELCIGGLKFSIFPAVRSLRINAACAGASHSDAPSTSAHCYAFRRPPGRP